MKRITLATVCIVLAGAAYYTHPGEVTEYAGLAASATTVLEFTDDASASDPGR